MRDNRNKWKFYKHPTKPKLKPEEVRYWRESLRKLLKVGIEFEFNLPEQKGKCRGDDMQCLCVHIEEGCWQECANIKKCKAEPCFDTCGKATDDCEPEKCAKCKKYKLSCIGTTCVEFASVCFSCNKYKKSCEECPKKYDPTKDPKNIRNTMSEELRPSNTYGKVSESGVVNIKQDGSLSGDQGAEIITVGRRVDFWEFYNMSLKILEIAKASGAFVNERTSSHMHVLASYYGGNKSGGTNANEMEKPMPEVVLANLHQLVRRYQNALTWMTMALNDPNHMTRWEKFRISVIDLSPVTKSMRQVADELAQHAGGIGRDKYGFINYTHTRFNNENISTLHVEMREPDSTMCPSWYAALACMHYAMVIKAVEISRYGLLKVADEEGLKEIKRMKKIILNGTGSWEDSRFGDTSKVLDHKDYFVKESLDLVNQLKSNLINLSPAYEILIKLAEKPVALRRIDGDDWDKIEKDLSVEMDEADMIEVKLNEIIDLSLINECENDAEWLEEVVRCVNDAEDMETHVTQDEVESFVKDKMRDGRLIWSSATGCMIKV
jgi:hypothetical protein